ncbi:hypothetical protein, partial [Massilia sp. ST3]|uniref:hypothetical protein n=1 Tax=Massilia sp. ST3 TaxID=2824903 RepID=UPI001B83DDF4
MPQLYADTGSRSPYYSPSGRIPVAIIPAAILLALAVLPGAWLYAWASVRAPWVIGCTVGLLFAAALALMVEYAVRKAKVRNPLWMGRMGILIGSSAWYAHWIAYLGIVSGLSVGQFEASPNALLNFLRIGASDLSVDSALFVGARLAELAMLLIPPYVFGKYTATE